MDWTWYLFRFEGRINRAKYWLAGLIALTTKFISGAAPGTFGFSIDDIFELVDPASLRSAAGKFRNGEWLSATILVPQIFHAVGTLLFLWVYASTSIKRLRDRDKSGWWTVPFFVVPGLYQQFGDRLGDFYIAVFFRAGHGRSCALGPCRNVLPARRPADQPVRHRPAAENPDPVAR
jgi:uncharacterized membrane protein YhaH (DUF805 family)